MGTLYRQGDVLLVKVDTELSLNARPRPREGGRVILARGEAAGHAHAIDSPLAELFDERDGRLYLRVETGPAARRPRARAARTHRDRTGGLPGPGAIRDVAD